MMLPAMSKSTKAVLAYMLGTFATYLLGAFVFFDLNATTWGTGERMMTAMFSVVIGIALAGIVVETSK